MSLSQDPSDSTPERDVYFRDVSWRPWRRFWFWFWGVISIGITVGASLVWAEETTKTGEVATPPVLAAVMALMVAATRLAEAMGRRRTLRRRIDVPVDLESRVSLLEQTVAEMRGRLEARLDRAVSDLDRGARSLAALQLDRAQNDATISGRLGRIESVLTDHIEANARNTKVMSEGLASLTEYVGKLVEHLESR